MEFFFNQSSVAHYFKDIIKTYFKSVKRGNYIHIFQQYQKLLLLEELSEFDWVFCKISYTFKKMYEGSHIILLLLIK